MKKIIIIFILLSVKSFSAKNFQFYNINGSEIIPKETEAISNYTFQKNYFPEYKYFYCNSVSTELYSDYFETGILAVYYQEFTNKPIYILGNSPTKEQIKKALNMFNYKLYIKESSFNYNLKNYIKNKELTIEDLYKTFGKPTKETSTSTLTFFHYNYPFLDFTIKDGIVIDYIFIKPD